jgi:ubiquinone/menaquinone biosynthesis C-methylase UbiE
MQTDTLVRSGFDARETYDEAAGDYQSAAAEFWEFLTIRTHALLGLSSGERVLDVATGTGSLLPRAARSVGPGGHVLGVDFAPSMLAISRERVRGLGNVELAAHDMAALPAGRFDAIACVLGLFFVDDMAGLVRSLAARLRPGGRLVVAVFGEDFYTPLADVFVAAVRAEDPAIEVVQPWVRTATEAALEDTFRRAGVSEVSIETQWLTVPIDTAGWRRIVVGSGLRNTLRALGPERAERVLRRCDTHIRCAGLRRVRVTARYAVVRAESGQPTRPRRRASAAASRRFRT